MVSYDETLNFAVARLRKALGDDGSNPRWIETVPHVGYRFIGEVRPAEPEVTDPSSGRPASAHREALTGRKLGALLLAAAVMAAIWGVARGTGMLAESRTDPLRLVVLPFDWVGPDADSALIRGIFDDLVTEMAMLDPDRLAVIAPASARRMDASRPDSLARLLDIDWMLSGSVHATGSEELRIHARLTRVPDGRVAWSERFVRERSVAPSISGPLVRRITTPLSLAPDLSLVGRPADTAATVRRGLRTARYLMDRGDSTGFRIAGETLAALARTGPRSAMVHAELAEWHARRAAWDSARVHAERAVELNARDPRGHRQLARALLETWDVAGAGRHYRRAVDLAPGVALYRAVLPAYLNAVGRHEAAVHHLERAVELDPLAPARYRDLGASIVFAGQPARAIPVCRRQGALDPEGPDWLFCLHRAFSMAGRPDSAAVYALRLMEAEGASPGDLENVRQHRDPERIVEAYRRWNADRLCRLHEEGRTAAYFVARAFALTGQADSAFRYLDASLEGHAVWALYAAWDPWFDAIREDARFQGFLRTVRERVARAQRSLDS